MARNVLETNRQNLPIPPQAKSTDELTNKRGQPCTRTRNTSNPQPHQPINWQTNE